MSTNGPDRRVRKLVEVINSYPGIQTLMSCGGHTRPHLGAGQLPKNEFFVDFGFTTPCPTQEAWQSLNEIAQYQYDFDIVGRDEWVKIEICKSKTNTIDFRLQGHNNDPNKIADRMLEIQKETASDYFQTLKPRDPSGYTVYRGEKITLEEVNALLDGYSEEQ